MRRLSGHSAIKGGQIFRLGLTRLPLEGSKDERAAIAAAAADAIRSLLAVTAQSGAIPGTYFLAKSRSFCCELSWNGRISSVRHRLEAAQLLTRPVLQEDLP